mmetsp:Transcript_11688/g.40650  ORF Transcript_11688/g.40650 Transcript_11688/m.40650 type:complete len:140 (+) Transcript_11688:348-767(+)
MASAGVGGPVFISVGDDEKLAKFLELNPAVPAERCFVDDSENFDAYSAAGFGVIGDTVPKEVKIAPPSFSWKQWLDYLANVAKLSPIRKGAPVTEFPTGVLRLGGTFALDGDGVAYAWADPVPGQHPSPAEVLSAAGFR